MTDLIAWLGYLGAGLLVAGPSWQAAIELHEENVIRERFEEVSNQIPQRRPSELWWLLPPVAYVRQERATSGLALDRPTGRSVGSETWQSCPVSISLR